MSSVTDLCFMCSNDNKCNQVDNRIITQVEYLMPEITIIKMDISLRICTSCEAELQSFNNFKKACVQNSFRLEAKIKEGPNSQNPGVQKEVDIVDTIEDDWKSETDSQGEETVEEDDTQETQEQIDMTDTVVIIEEIEDLSQENISTEKDNKNTVSKFDSKINNTNNGFVCETCSKWFKFKSNFERHMITHTEIREFQCEICTKLFREYSHLKSHIKMHCGIKNYKCNICDKFFVQNSHLKDHIKVHTGLKDFKCGICKRLFSRNSNLKRHLETHFDEDGVQCKICNKLFALKTSLRGHMKCHTKVGDINPQVSNQA